MNASCWNLIGSLFIHLHLSVFFLFLHSFLNLQTHYILALAGFVVGDPKRFGGGHVPGQPHRDPVHGEQLRGVTYHGEGIHERCHEDQSGRLPGRILCAWV